MFDINFLSDEKKIRPLACYTSQILNDFINFYFFRVCWHFF